MPAKITGDKLCKGCNEHLPYTPEFFYKLKNSKYSVGYALSALCKKCYSTKQVAKQKATGVTSTAKVRAWLKRNQHKVLEASVKRFTKYAGMPMDVETYTSLRSKQNNTCAICGNLQEGQRLSIDHDHKSKKIRGLLCESCNLGLGKFKDNIMLLEKAISYLKRHK